MGKKIKKRKRCHECNSVRYLKYMGGHPVYNIKDMHDETVSQAIALGVMNVQPKKYIWKCIQCPDSAV